MTTPQRRSGVEPPLHVLCGICGASSHATEQHYDAAFTNPMTGEPYPVPADIKQAALRICMAYSSGIRGICDPMYIANVIALELLIADLRALPYDYIIADLLQQMIGKSGL